MVVVYVEDGLLTINDNEKLAPDKIEGVGGSIGQLDPNEDERLSDGPTE